MKKQIQFPVTVPCRMSPLHAGGNRCTDLFAPQGTEILAPENGHVRSEFWPLGGHNATLEGVSGREFYFAHLLEKPISGKVKKGDVIGRLGRSGSAKGGCAHVHVAISDEGERVDDFGAGSSETFSILESAAHKNVTIEHVKLSTLKPETLFIVALLLTSAFFASTNETPSSATALAGVSLMISSLIWFGRLRASLYHHGQDFSVLARRTHRMETPSYSLHVPILLSMLLLSFGGALVARNSLFLAMCSMGLVVLGYMSRDMEQY